MAALGWIYVEGFCGVERDVEKGAAYWIRAVNPKMKLGDWPLAEIRDLGRTVARCYRDGVGVERNAKKAEELEKREWRKLEGVDKSQFKKREVRGWIHSMWRLPPPRYF